MTGNAAIMPVIQTGGSQRSRCVFGSSKGYSGIKLVILRWVLCRVLMNLIDYTRQLIWKVRENMSFA